MLQKVLTANYPKVRKGLFVFPINFFVQIFWDSLIKPVLSTLQPDIEDKISPLTNDWKLEWRKRFDLEQTEIEFGGLLDVRSCQPLRVPYTPVALAALLPSASVTKNVVVLGGADVVRGEREEWADVRHQDLQFVSGVWLTGEVVMGEEGRAEGEEGREEEEEDADEWHDCLSSPTVTPTHSRRTSVTRPPSSHASSSSCTQEHGAGAMDPRDEEFTLTVTDFDDLLLDQPSAAASAAPAPDEVSLSLSLAETECQGAQKQQKRTPRELQEREMAEAQQRLLSDTNKALKNQTTLMIAGAQGAATVVWDMLPAVLGGDVHKDPHTRPAGDAQRDTRPSRIESPTRNLPPFQHAAWCTGRFLAGDFEFM